MSSTLPLFPLGTVLAPGGVLPLQVFEPRYVRLLSDLVEASRAGAEPDFGVVLIRAGHEVGPERARDLHAVGTIARVTQAAELGDERFLMVSRGTTRFTLTDFTAAGELEAGAVPYPTGTLELLPEPDGADAAVLQGLADSVRAAATAYVRSVGEPERAEALAADPGALSHGVGEVMGAEVGDRQRLLAAPDTAARLRMALQLVRRESGVLEQFGAVPGNAPMPFNPN